MRAVWGVVGLRSSAPPPAPGAGSIAATGTALVSNQSAGILLRAAWGGRSLSSSDSPRRRAVSAAPRRASRRPVAMLTHSYYEEDPRVRREAECLAAAGYPVDVFALRQPGAGRVATIDGVAVHRLDVQRHQGA